MDSVGIQDYLKEVHDRRMSKSSNGRRRKVHRQDARRDLSLSYICFVAYHVAYLRSLDRRTKFFVAAYHVIIKIIGKVGPLNEPLNEPLSEPLKGPESGFRRALGELRGTAPGQP
jgi:hypothetical protein